jgi:hypothetical protein
LAGTDINWGGAVDHYQIHQENPFLNFDATVKAGSYLHCKGKEKSTTTIGKEIAC